MAALREVLASFGLEFDKSNELGKAHSKIGGLTKLLTGVGAALAGAFAVDKIISFGHGLIEAADNIGDTSDRLGISAKQLQQWSFAAKLSGADAEDFTGAVQRLGGQLAKAGAGDGNAEVFKKLGVNLKDSQGNLRSTGDVFEDVAGQIGAISNPTEQAGAAAAIFGKSYSKLLPLFRRGPEGLAKIREEFEKLGGGFSDDFVQKSSDFQDNIDRLKVSGTSLASSLLGPLLPVFNELSTAVIGFVRSITEQSTGSNIITEVAHSVVNILKVFTRMNTQTGFLSKIVTGFGVIFRAMAPTYRALLRFEDLLVFLTGGKSLLGEGIDKQFGKGSQQKVLAYFEEMKTGFTNAIRLVTHLSTAGQLAAVQLSSEAETISSAFELAAAATKSFFVDAFNSIIDGAAAMVVALGEAVQKLPGGDKLSGALALSAVGIEGQRINAPSGVGGVLARHQAKQLEFGALQQNLSQGLRDPASPQGGPAAQAQANALLTLAKATASQAHAPVAATAAAPAPSAPPQWLIDGISNTANVTINVPAGTDAAVTRDIGKAAKDGASKAFDLRNVKASLVPTAG